jgi:hypothetical protein
MIALLLAAAAAVPQTLPEVQRRLLEERAQAAKLAGRESSLLGRLTELERQVELEGRALRAAQFRLRTANQRLVVVEERASVAQAELDLANDVVSPRLMARYRSRAPASSAGSSPPYSERRKSTSRRCASWRKPSTSCRRSSPTSRRTRRPSRPRPW